MKLPDYMANMMEAGVLGNKSGGGFFKKDGNARLALQPSSGDYVPESEIKLPNLSYIDEVAQMHSVGRYEEGMALFLAAEGDEAALARKVIAGYVSYAFHRAGEVTETITGIDMIMGAGFNWAPPSVLVDTMGIRSAVAMIEAADLPVPAILAEAVAAGKSEKFFNHQQVNVGKYFVAS
jgi:3-hydroxyacyl-CoA dehydrogenase